MVPRQNPIGKLKDATVGTLKHPVGTTRNVLGQTVGLGKAAVRVVGGSAQAGATGLVHRATGLVPGRAPSPPGPAESSEPVAEPDDAAKPRKVQGDPLLPAGGSARSRPPSKRPAKKPAKKSSPRKAAAPTPADVADNVGKASGQGGTTDDRAADKPTRKPTKKSASKRPPTAAELAAGEDQEVTTPVGTPGADVATNPDTSETDLQQPGTEPIVDPATTKAVASESETLQKGADPDKG
jgi:hypothetical protein